MTEVQATLTLNKQLEKLISDGKKDQAQLIIRDYLKQGRAEEIKSAFRGITQPEVKVLTDRWLKDIAVRYPDKAAQPPKPKPTTSTFSPPIPKQGVPKPAAKKDDNDDLGWLINSASTPQGRSADSKRKTGPQAALDIPNPKQKSNQKTYSNEGNPNNTSMPSPAPRVKTMIESRQLPAFLMRYWPGVTWFLIALIGVSLMISAFVFQHGVGWMYAIYAVVYYPLAVIRHIRLNAFIRFRTSFFTNRRYVGASRNTLYYQDQPDTIRNWVINAALTLLSMFYLYAFRELFAQGRFLINAYREWGQGRNLETRSAKWGRGWRR